MLILPKLGMKLDNYDSILQNGFGISFAHLSTRTLVHNKVIRTLMTWPHSLNPYSQ